MVSKTPEQEAYLAGVEAAAHQITELRAENERLRAVAQAANDAYLAWTKDRSQEDLDSCMTILCALLDTWDTWREQQIRDAC